MHREERDFSLIFQLCAEFDKDYTGERDGFAWHERFEQHVKPRLVAAILEVLRSDPEWEVRPAPRGRDPERALEFELKYKERAR